MVKLNYHTKHSIKEADCYLPSKNYLGHPSFYFITCCQIFDFLFLNFNLYSVPQYQKNGRKGFSNHAMICSFIVMKCEDPSMITELVDYLNNNHLIAYYCGFNISLLLSSYWTFYHFLKNFKLYRSLWYYEVSGYFPCWQGHYWAFFYRTWFHTYFHQYLTQ